MVITDYQFCFIYLIKNVISAKMKNKTNLPTSGYVKGGAPIAHAARTLLHTWVFSGLSGAKQFPEYKGISSLALVSQWNTSMWWTNPWLESWILDSYCKKIAHFSMQNDYKELWRIVKQPIIATTTFSNCSKPKVVSFGFEQIWWNFDFCFEKMFLIFAWNMR